MIHSISQKLLARYFAALLVTSGVVSALVHPLPNLTGMSGAERALITFSCVGGGCLIWVLPWDRWPRTALVALPPVGMLVKMWANLHGGLGPYSYSIHFVLIYVWMGVALPRGLPLRFAPLLAVAYCLPLLSQGDPRQIASLAMILPICVVIGESVAWISARLREVERVDFERLRSMEWLVSATFDLARDQEEGALRKRVAHLANDLPGAPAAAVLLFAPGRMLEVVASAGWTAPLAERFPVVDTPALLEAVRTRDFLDDDHSDCIGFARSLGVPRLSIAPLVGTSRCIGLVLLVRESSATRFDRFTQYLIRTLLVQSSLAIERIRDREGLRDASLHDELTKLGNRRKANACIAKLHAGDALVMLDLDHFKRVNDEHGHAKGDQVLRELARFLGSVLREGDQAFRIGGEEFLVVLDRAEEGTEIAAERICSGWRQRDPITTLSAGVAVHRDGETPEQTLARADQALYAAKDGGRDRVVLS